MQFKKIRTTKLLAGFRMMSGFSQEDLARAIGRTQAFISYVEAGELRPSEEDQKKIADFFGVPINITFLGSLIQ